MSTFMGYEVEGAIPDTGRRAFEDAQKTFYKHFADKLFDA
jgi:hypothetical protein